MVLAPSLSPNSLPFPASSPLAFGEENGIFLNVSWSDYERASGVRQSLIKRYLKGVPQPKRVPREPRTALRLGTVGHCLLLEPERFYRTYARAPEGTPATQMQDWMHFEELPTSAQRPFWLPAHFWDSLHNLRRAFAVHPRLQDLWSAGDAEVSLLWSNPVNGFRCKGRLDWVNWNQRTLVDLKLTQETSRASCEQKLRFGHYDLQAAWYAEGLKALTGQEFRVMVAFLQKYSPHAIQCYDLEASQLAGGAAKMANAWANYQKKHPNLLEESGKSSGEASLAKSKPPAF